jgi:hypothetical protein
VNSCYIVEGLGTAHRAEAEAYNEREAEMPGKADTREGIAAALAETKFPTDESSADDGWDSFEAEASTESTEEAPAATPGEPPSKVELEKPEDETEDESPVEVPEVYWGTDLTGIPAEKRAELIAHFEQQDSTIKKLQGKVSALSQPDDSAPAPVTPDEPVEVTDEVLLRAAGLDPEAFETQQAAPMLLPVLRRTLALEDKVDEVLAKTQSNETERAWNSSLDELEGTFGKLGFDRNDVLRYAIAEKIGSPHEAYFKLSAPIKREIDQAAAIARREALKKEAAGGVKPRGNAAGEPAIPKGTSLRDAVKQAAKAAEKETKLSWRSAVKRRVTLPQE